MAKTKKLTKTDKKAFVVEQDIKLAKVLAGNNKRLRERAVKNLKKWFEHRSIKMPFTEEDFLRIWKGLFYSMWMSDKPLIQEECAENIASLVHFSAPEASLLFFKCGLITLNREWFGIDQLRLDKFLMFTRRLLRQGFEILKKQEWKTDLIANFSDVLSDTVLGVSNDKSLGLAMHVTEIYLEELAKVSNGDIDTNITVQFLSPFVKQLTLVKDSRQVSHIMKFVFRNLLWQSDAAVEYHEKFSEWKNQGFPGGTIAAMLKEDLPDDENMSTDDDDEEVDDSTKVLDPRAGRVDVVLPRLKFDAAEVCQLLKSHKFVNSTTKGRKAITRLANEFHQMSLGTFPLGVQKISLPEDDGYSTKLRQSVNRLVKLDKKLLSADKAKRKRKLRTNIQENLSPQIAKKQKIDDSLDDSEDLNAADFFQKKLEAFVRKSEKNVKPNKRKTKKGKRIKKNGNQLLLDSSSWDEAILKMKTEKQAKRSPSVVYRVWDPSWKLENAFRRNSGTWHVYKDDDQKSNGTVQAESSLNSTKLGLEIERKLDEISGTPSKRTRRSTGQSHQGEFKISPDVVGKNHAKTQSPNAKKQIKLNNSSPTRGSPRGQKNVSIVNNTPSSEKPPGKVSSNSKISPVFSINEWAFNPEPGEIEIFIPSKKYKAKMEKLAKRSGQALPDVLHNSLEKLATSKRKSGDSSVVKNPFSKRHSLPQSAKKVKIDLKLNQSQEIHEHHAQLRNSPNIPYDANRKPMKPLLKPCAVGSPINPFYKRKLRLK